jgi:penicillin-binding protein 1A
LPAAVAAGFVAALLFLSLQNLPAVDALQNFAPPGTTQFFDRNGETIGEVFHEKRLPVLLEEIPTSLSKAVVAIEDSQFYDHPGISLKGVARAFFKNLVKGRVSQGGSTLTQQLAKVLFLTPERSIVRKIKEALLALQIEKRYTKDEILEMYLNQIYLGDGNYGIAAAAKYYFCKDLIDLELHEVATIAALPKAPSFYAPTRNPEKTKIRRNYVIKMMHANQFISSEQMALAQTMPVASTPCPTPGTKSFVITSVIRQLIDELGASQVLRGKLKVHTTIDANLQRASEQAIVNGLKSFSKRRKIDHGDPMVAEYSGPEASLVAIDSISGEILAFVGGSNFRRSQYNRITQAKRQAGSTFKLFTFATAIENGFTQSTIVNDLPLSFSDGRGGSYQPKNYTNDFLGSMTLRTALAKSRNTVAVQLAAQFGLDQVLKTARRFGISTELPYNLTVAIGSASVSLMELTAAYSVITASGIYSQPHLIRRVDNDRGENIFSPAVETRRPFDTAKAYVVKDMLRGVWQNYRLSKSSPANCDLGGKTGTTNRYTDALFIGFADHITIGVRAGFDNNQPLGKKESGSRVALPIWAEVAKNSCMTFASRLSNQLPKEVVSKRIDLASGKLSPPTCPKGVAAAFLKGTEPQQIAPCK